MISTIINYCKGVLENTPLFNLISFVITILSIILSIYLYFKSKRQRLPTYVVRSVNLIEDSVSKLNEIEILYAKSKVRNLSVARIAFWNAGSETINGSDVTKASPLKVVGREGVDFLGLEIVYEKNKANNFNLSPVNDPEEPGKHLQNEMEITFDYIDKNEGIILQVFHTGKTNENIEIQGVIKGSKTIYKVGTPFFNRVQPISNYLRKIKREHKKLILGTVLLLTPLFILPIEVVTILRLNGYAFLLLIPMLLISILYWCLAFSMLRKRVPKGFSLFEAELPYSKDE